MSTRWELSENWHFIFAWVTYASNNIPFIPLNAHIFRFNSALYPTIKTLTSGNPVQYNTWKMKKDKFISIHYNCTVYILGNKTNLAGVVDPIVIHVLKQCVPIPLYGFKCAFFMSFCIWMIRMYQSKIVYIIDHRLCSNVCFTLHSQHIFLHDYNIELLYLVLAGVK